MAQEEYDDLPSAPSDSAPASTAATQEPIPAEEQLHGIAPVLSLILGLLAVILGWLIHRCRRKNTR